MIVHNYVCKKINVHSCILVKGICVYFKYIHVYFICIYIWIYTDNRYICSLCMFYSSFHWGTSFPFYYPPTTTFISLSASLAFIAYIFFPNPTSDIQMLMYLVHLNMKHDKLDFHFAHPLLSLVSYTILSPQFLILLT